MRNNPFFPLAAKANEVLAANVGTASVAGDVGAALAWAAFHAAAADIARVIVGTLQSNSVRLQKDLDTSFEALEVAAMTLGFGNAASSMDLCAHAIYLANGGSHGKNARFCDLAELTQLVARGKIALEPRCQKWLDVTNKNSVTRALTAYRHHIIHRTIRRHTAMNVSTNVRSLASVQIPGRRREGLEKLIPRLVDFAGRRTKACSLAVARDFR
jgi:hypothetical protein